MPAYYNEIDPFAAAWLRELIKNGHIADGEVDERSIADVQASDLAGFAQCHFFAGIGVWSYALRLAGWADERSVWTGSCPCQPFSVAGKGLGAGDDRHLWPEFARLISQCRPATVFGEQVASKAGRSWLHGVRADMEAMGYAVGAADLCAAGVGAPHIRQRLYWVADADHQHKRTASDTQRVSKACWNISTRRMADSSGAGLEGGHEGKVGSELQAFERGGSLGERTGPTNGHWRNADWIFCRDGKWRPVEPGTFPLAHGSAARVGRLRGYGNAIVAPQAKAFIEAYLAI